jgi:hypothetical protein
MNPPSANLTGSRFHGVDPAAQRQANAERIISMLEDIQRQVQLLAAQIQPQAPAAPARSGRGPVSQAFNSLRQGNRWGGRSTARGQGAKTTKLSDYFATQADFEQALGEAYGNAGEKDHDFLAGVAERYEAYGMQSFMSPAQHEWFAGIGQRGGRRG